MMSAPISIDRTFGFYSMSIGTSLAFEGLLHTGEFANNKSKVKVTDFQRIYLNIRTLFRNVFGAFEDKAQHVTPDVMITSITEDLNRIIETVTAVSPSTKIVPYLCTYTTVNKEFPLAKFKNADTPNQIFYSSVEQDVYKQMAKEDNEYGIKVFDSKINGDFDTLIVTHMPADLLCYRKFPTLMLLESHTGKVKGHLEWYSKLNSKNAKIPFNRPFLLIFGDGVMFSPQDLKVRRVIIKTAEKYNWRPDTTLDRIHNCLKLVNEPHVSEFIRRYT